MSQINTVNDIAPLVRPTHLQDCALTTVKLKEVISLHHHIVKFEQRKRAFALKALFHAVKGQHTIDRKIAPIIAQEGKIREII